MSFRALNAKPCRRIAVTSHATGHTLRRPAIASDRPGDSPIISAGHSCGIYFGTDRRDQFSGKAACSSSRLRLSRMRLADCLQALAVAKWPVEITPSWALRLPSSRSTLPAGNIYGGWPQRSPDPAGQGSLRAVKDRTLVKSPSHRFSRYLHIGTVFASRLSARQVGPTSHVRGG